MNNSETDISFRGNSLRGKITQITPGDSHVTRVEDVIWAAVSFRSWRPTEVRNRNLRNPPPQKPTARQVLCDLRIYLRFPSWPLCLCGEFWYLFASIRPAAAGSRRRTSASSVESRWRRRIHSRLSLYLRKSASICGSSSSSPLAVKARHVLWVMFFLDENLDS